VAGGHRIGISAAGGVTPAMSLNPGLAGKT